MSNPVLEVERSGAVAVLTLNRPEAMNALSMALRAELTRAFTELEADSELRVVILTGAGRAFCAGFDLKEMAGGQAGTGPDAIGTGMQQAIESFSGPIIGAVNGHAITGGFELALACDVLIASTRAVFADTHARVGILPGWGLSQRLPRRIGSSRAKEISFTGNFVDAARAEAYGLVSHVVEPEELLPACRALAEDMISCNAEALRGVKRLIDVGGGMPLAEALAWETREAIASAAQMTAGRMAERKREVEGRGRALAGKTDPEQ